MARTFLTALDLRGNELRNARVQNLAGAPVNPAPGQLYYNSAANTMFWFDGVDWVDARTDPALRSDMEAAIASVRNDFDAADDTLRIEYGQADSLLRTEFTNADTALRNDFTAADVAERDARIAADDSVRAYVDTVVARTEVTNEDGSVTVTDDFDRIRSEFAAADSANMAAIQSQFQQAQDAATSDHASIRTDFATADNAVRTEFAAGDAAVRDEFAAADTALRAAITAEMTAADAALRNDFDAADAAIRTEFANADQALDASLRTYVDNQMSATNASNDASLDDLRNDMNAADAAIRAEFATADSVERDARTAADTDLRNYINTTVARVETTNPDGSITVVDDFDRIRTEFADADDAVRMDFAAADDAVRTEVSNLDATIRAEFTAADDQLRTDLNAGDAAVRAEFADADSALAATLRTEYSNADAAIRADLAAGDTAARDFAVQRANHTGTQLAETISDFGTAVRAVPVNELGAATGDLSAGGFRVTGLAAPIDANDAATRGYVDGLTQGLDVKASVRAATTGPITRSGTQTIDGVALAAGDRVLVKNQVDPAENGIYTVSTGNWQRSGDANDPGEVTSGMFTFVEEGEANADSGWVLTTDDVVTLGTTPLSFSQFSGAGQVVAGNGLTKDGNTLNVVGTAGRVNVTADAVDIATDYVGQGSITTVGTLTAGALGEGFTTVGLAQGGTGATNALEARANLGATTKFAQTLNAGLLSGTTETHTVTHNLGTQDVLVGIYETAAPYGVAEADIEITDANTVTIRFGVAQPAGAFRAVIVG